MTEETLDFARGAARLVVRPVALGLLLAELVASIEQELPGLSALRDFQVPNTMPLMVDVDKLRRAIMNIASNARDAMGGHGTLTFSARVLPLEGLAGASDHLVLELADEGPGVPPEIRDRVFEPFVSVGKKRGTGLGLAVARRFVEDHGGSLELMPAQRAPGTRRALPPRAAGRGPGGSRRRAPRGLPARTRPTLGKDRRSLMIPACDPRIRPRS